MARKLILQFMLVVAFATLTAANRELFQDLGDDCASLGPDGWWSCCESKNEAEDSSCPPPVCGELSEQFVGPCCASKGPASNDTSCAAGSTCETEGPANWWSCCQTKAEEGEEDSTCPPESCAALEPQANIDACCASKEGVSVDPSCTPVNATCASEDPAQWWPCCEAKAANGTADTSCPPRTCGDLRPQANVDACCASKEGGSTPDESCSSGPGATCSSEGATNWWPCCEEKMNNGVEDESCPPAECGLLEPEANIDACCAYKGGPANDTSCTDPVGDMCSSKGPAEWWTCCQEKASEGVADESCPPPECGQLTSPADIDACCSSKGGYANDTSCPCDTAGPEGYWPCCETKAFNGTEDDTCPPPVCGDLTPVANVGACCAAKGGYANDTSCPCDTAGPEGYWPCCETKASSGTEDDTCPPPVCGDLTPAANVDACCAAKGGYANDTSCPCATAGPEGYWSCCEDKASNETADDTCPPPECGALAPQENINACCISKGGYKGDNTCPPPCDTEGPEGWWACCERRFEDLIPDDTCPPPTCGVLKPAANVDNCCEYKGIFTSDNTCPLVVCYDYEDTMKTLMEIFATTVEMMETTDNATEVRSIGTEGMAQMVAFVAGDATDFNSTIVFSNYPIPDSE